jgi:hypothetical protein
MLDKVQMNLSDFSFNPQNFIVKAWQTLLFHKIKKLFVKLQECFAICKYLLNHKRKQPLHTFFSRGKSNL